MVSSYARMHHMLGRTTAFDSVGLIDKAWIERMLVCLQEGEGGLLLQALMASLPKVPEMPSKRPVSLQRPASSPQQASQV